MTLRIELVDAQNELLRAIADPSCNREDIADDYACGLLADVSTGGTQRVDWPGVNAAILKRYTPGGLRYIKNRAWRVVKDGNP